VSTSKNYTTPALSDLHTDRDVPVAVYPDENDRGALAVKVINSSSQSSNPYAPPANTTRTTDETVGNVQTVKHFNGLTLLKTITITYTGCDKEAVVTVP